MKKNVIPVAVLLVGFMTLGIFVFFIARVDERPVSVSTTPTSVAHYTTTTGVTQPLGQPPVPSLKSSSTPASTHRPIFSPPVSPSSTPGVSGIGLDYSAFPKDNDTSRDRNTLYVAPTGLPGADGSAEHPFNSLYTALSRAEAHSIIIMRAGNYTDCGEEHACFGLNITKSGIRITSRGEQVTITPSGKSNYGLVIEANDVVVDGINMEGFPNNGINLGNNTRGIVIKNLAISGGSSDGIAAYGAQHGLLLKNVRIVDSDVQGLTCGKGPCTNWHLDTVTVRNGSGGTGSGADAIAIESGDNVLIENTDVSGAAADGIDLKATRVVVRNTIVHDVGRNGVKFWKGGDLINSVVSRTGADASVSFAGAGGTRAENTYRVVNTTITRHNERHPELNAYSLVVAYDRPHNPVLVEIRDSVFSRNTNGIYFSPATTVKLYNNLFQPGYNNNRVMDVTIGGERKAISGSDDVAIINDGVAGSGNMPFETQVP